MEATEALKGLAERLVELAKAGADGAAIADASRAGTATLLGLRREYRDCALER